MSFLCLKSSTIPHNFQGKIKTLFSVGHELLCDLMPKLPIGFPKFQQYWVKEIKWIPLLFTSHNPYLFNMLRRYDHITKRRSEYAVFPKLTCQLNPFLRCLINVTYNQCSQSYGSTTPFSPSTWDHPSKSLKDFSSLCLYAYCWFCLGNPFPLSPSNHPQIFKAQFKQPHFQTASPDILV